MSSWAILNFTEAVNPSLIAVTDTTDASGFRPLTSEDLYFDVHALIYVR